MKLRKKMTEIIRDKIKIYKKNNKDISELIEDYDLKGEDLSRCLIKKLNRINEDISNTNFFGSIIGEEGATTILSGCDLRNCNFSTCKFLGHLILRASDMRNSTFISTWFPDVEYQYADFRDVVLCSAVMKFGINEGLNAKFSKKTFEELFSKWIVE